MKKLLFTLAIAALAIMNAYAEEKTAAVVSTENNQLVLDENGTQISFALKADATIADAEGNAVELAALDSGSKVKVEYTVTPEGINEASAVNAVNEEASVEAPEASEAEVKE